MSVRKQDHPECEIGNLPTRARHQRNELRQNIRRIMIRPGISNTTLLVRDHERLIPVIVRATSAVPLVVEANSAAKARRIDMSPDVPLSATMRSNTRHVLVVDSDVANMGQLLIHFEDYLTARQPLAITRIVCDFTSNEKVVATLLRAQPGSVNIVFKRHIHGKNDRDGYGRALTGMIRRLPTVYIVGYAASSDNVDMKTCGLNDFLTLPLNRSEVWA